MSETAAALLERQKQNLIGLIDYTQGTILQMESDLAAEQEKLHSLLADEKFVEDALAKVAA